MTHPMLVKEARLSQSADPIAVALGADRVILLQTDALAGPLSWLQLQEEVTRHVQSFEEQPNAPAWDFRCFVPLPDRSWQHLVHLTARLRQQGTFVNPDQLAGILLERQIEMLHEFLKVEDEQVQVTR